MNKLNLKSVIWNEGKYYVAQCLNVDVSSFGKSKKEALTNLNEAVSLYFEDEKLQNITKVNRVEVVPFALRYA
ncbi:MAG: type II toxin-antitoxin system HicB family antitoxin [Candidatus Vogelbacteria bacterium]